MLEGLKVRQLKTDISSVPAGSLAVALLVVTLPTGFPDHGHGSSSNQHPLLSWELLRKIDVLGASLLLAASVFLISALQEAADGVAWRKPLVIVLLVLSFPPFVGFLFWEWFVTSDKRRQEPVFPWRFITSRVRMSLILSVSPKQQHESNQVRC